MIVLFIPVLTLAAIEECQRVQSTKLVPCSIPASYTPSTGCNANISIYLENGTYVQSLSWNTSIPFCKYTWNISTEGTYIYNSSIEDGVITLERPDNMLGIIISFIFIIAFFAAIGVPQPQGVVKFFTFGMALIELLMMIWIILINESGGSIINLLRINAIGVLIIGGGIGIYSLFIMSSKLVRLDDDDKIQDDDWIKWQNR